MNKEKQAWRSPWVIGWVALVAVVLLANITMIYLAMNNNPGLVVEDYYERGQDHEKTMLERMRNNPGWEMHIDPPSSLVQGTNATFNFSVRDSSGQPITPGRVTLYAYRPSDARMDFSTPMRIAGAGSYRTEVSFPLKGVWDLLFSVESGTEEYNAALRINVAPSNSLIPASQKP